MMDADKHVLGAASFYSKSYFFNDLEFAGLPQGVQDELKILLVEAAEYTMGVVMAGFTTGGETFVEASGAPEDFEYDEIGAKYHINGIVKDQEAFLQSLSLWYNLVINTNLQPKSH